MDPIRDAFQKIKHDIYSLYSEVSSLKRDRAAMNHEMAKISEILTQLSEITRNISKKQQKNTENRPKNTTPTHPAIRQINQANHQEKQTVPTHNSPYSYLINKEKQAFSTGNEGVPTDRQTDRQTDTKTQKTPLFTPKYIKKDEFHKNPIEDAARALDSLDSLKKEIRLKFKQLTDQEILVFSTLYQIEEEQGSPDYNILAVKLNLTESSIRDYIGRLLKKGIPVEKHKIHNKKILLSVSQSLKRVASLQTILQLRDL